MVQQLAMAMGIALGAAALKLAGLLGPASAAGVIPLSHFRIAFLLVGGIGLLEGFDLFRLDPGAGASLRQRKPPEAPKDQAAVCG
jgi:hypothetical protein